MKFGLKGKNPRLRFLTDDEEEGGSTITFGDGDEEFEGETPSGDEEQEEAPVPPEDGLDDIFGDKEGKEGEEEDPNAWKAGDEPTNNPAIKALLDDVREALPLGLHSLVIDEHLLPELTKMQRGIDKEFSKFEPYRDLIKQGVTMEQVTGALGMAQWINENPGEALQQLDQVARARGLNPAEILGIKMAQQQAAVEGQQQQPPAANEDDAALAALFGGEAPEGMAELLESPAGKALLGQVAAIKAQQESFVASQQDVGEQQRHAEENQRIDTAVNTVKDAFVARGLPFNKGAVIQYAVDYVNSLPAEQRNIDELEAIKRGAANWHRDVSAAATASQKRAPRVGGGAGRVGAAGQPTKQAGPLTMEQRLAKFKESAGNILAGGED